MRRQIRAQRFRFRRNLPKLKRARMCCASCDRLANFRLRRLAKAGQLRDPARFACLQQLRDGTDLQVCRGAP